MNRISPILLSLLFVLSSLAGCMETETEVIVGCTDPTANNFNIDATQDNDNTLMTMCTYDGIPIPDDPDDNEVECPNGSIESSEWGKPSCLMPQVFAASDVSEDTIRMTLDWYGIAAREWGNYGPVEIYIVGESLEAAKTLEDEYCERHKALDSKWKEEWDCANENYQIFTHYVDEGGAAVSTFMRSYLDYDFSMVILSAKHPGPHEDDYKPVVLHEYFHIYQHAHINDKCGSDSREVCERDAKMGGKNKPWFAEGGAEYMAQSLYSKQPGVRDNYFQEVMRWKLEGSLEGYKDQDLRLDELSYDSDVGVYDIGSWFIAYLIHNEGESAFVDGFYDDLNELGFDASFEKNFNKTRSAYLEQFDIFLNQTIDEIMTIIPENSQPVTNSSCVNNETQSQLNPGVTEVNLTQEIDGEQVVRRFLIHSPENIDSSQCYPLLFVLHGNGGEPDGFVNQYRGLVNEGRFVAVYPAGVENSWNLGREASTANDTEFLESVADELQSYGNLDHERRYVVGFSNGAGLAQTLGNDSDYFRAFVAVVTSLTTENIPTEQSHNPSVMQILGADDDLVPYEGGEGVGGHVFLSGDESARVWAEHNSCNMTAENTTLGDGSIRTLYTNCIDGGEVVNYKVAQTGHFIPGNFEGDLNLLIWDFLSRH